MLAELGINSPSEEDLSALRYIVEAVSRRAGFMASAGITALLKKMDYRDVVIAIDGSVFRYHPHFPNIMRSRYFKSGGNVELNNIPFPNLCIPYMVFFSVG